MNFEELIFQEKTKKNLSAHMQSTHASLFQFELNKRGYQRSLFVDVEVPELSSALIIEQEVIFK